MSKAFKRIYTGSYFLWLLSGFIAVFMLVKFSLIVSLIAAIMMCLVLATIIVGNVFFAKKDSFYIRLGMLLTLIGVGALLLFILLGFILTIVVTAIEGSPTYAWIMSSLGMVFGALASYFLIRCDKKYLVSDEFTEIMSVEEAKLIRDGKEVPQYIKDALNKKKKEEQVN